MNNRLTPDISTEYAAAMRDISTALSGVSLEEMTEMLVDLNIGPAAYGIGRLLTGPPVGEFTRAEFISACVSAVLMTRIVDKMGAGA
jgi:hypothetical protein